MFNRSIYPIINIDQIINIFIIFAIRTIAQIILLEYLIQFLIPVLPVKRRISTTLTVPPTFSRINFFNP